MRFKRYEVSNIIEFKIHSDSHRPSLLYWSEAMKSSLVGDWQPLIDEWKKQKWGVFDEVIPGLRLDLWLFNDLYSLRVDLDETATNTSPPLEVLDLILESNPPKNAFMAFDLDVAEEDKKQALLEVVLTLGWWDWIKPLIDKGYSIDKRCPEASLVCLIVGRKFRRYKNIKDAFSFPDEFNLDENDEPFSNVYGYIDGLRSSDGEMERIREVLNLLKEEGVDLEARLKVEIAFKIECVSGWLFEYGEPAVIAAVRSNDAVLLEALIDCGVKCYSVNSYFTGTPLLLPAFAAEIGQADALEVLMRKTNLGNKVIKVTKKDEVSGKELAQEEELQRLTPYSRASIYGNEECLNVLLCGGWMNTEQLSVSFRMAIAEDQVRVMGWFYEKGCFDKLHDDEYAPYWAVEFDSYSCLKWMEEKRVDLNAEGGSKLSPMWIFYKKFPEDFTAMFPSEEKVFEKDKESLKNVVIFKKK